MACPCRILIAVFLALAGTAGAADTARDLRDQALADLRGIQTAAPVQQHVTNAIRSLERDANAFTDGNHISDAGVYNGLRSAANSCAEGAKASLQRSDRAMADRLKGDADRLARAARLLASTAAADVRARSWIIDVKSARHRDRRLASSDQALAAGDAENRTNDNSFQRWNFAWPRFENAIDRWKQAWKKGTEAAEFRLALVSAQDWPDPLSPNGDGRNDTNTLTIVYRIRVCDDAHQIHSEWTIRTAAGAVIRTLASDTAVPARRRGDGERYREVRATLVWDGRDSGGQAAAGGTYPYQVTAALLPRDHDEGGEDGDREDDDDGDREDRDRPRPDRNALERPGPGTVTIDLEPPAIAALAPAPGGFRRDARPQASATWSDASGIDLSSFRFYQNGQDVTPNAAATAGGFTFTPVQDVPEGTVTLRVEVRDNAGNVATSEWQYVADRSGPAITPAQPTDGAFVGSLRPTIAATTSDPLSGVDASLSRLVVDGGDVTGQATVTAGGLTYTPTSDLREGRIAVQATATDRAGNVSSVTWSFTMDVTPPAIAELVPAPDSASRDPRQPMSGSLSDLSGVDPGLVRVTYGGQDVTASSQVSATGFAFTPSADVPEGAVALTVEATDRAGNRARREWSFTADRTAPELGTPSPADGAYVGNAQPTVSVAFADALAGVDVASVSITVRGDEVTRTATVTSSGVTYTPPLPLTDGALPIRVVVRDLAGNAAQIEWTPRIDTTPPEWSDVRPANAITTENRREPFEAVPTDGISGVDLASVRIRVDGRDVTTDPGVRILPDRVTFTPGADFLDGPHRYEADVSDRLGNAAPRMTVDFTVASAAARLDPAQGGTDAVTDRSSPILGASIEIPGAALSGRSTVAIQDPGEVLPFPPDEVAAGPAVLITSSAGDFVADVTIRIPYDPAIFASAGLTAEAAVLFVLEEGTGTWVQVPIQSVDTTNRVVVALRRNLSVFRVGYLRPDAARSSVVALPSSLPVDQTGLIVVTLRTVNGAPIGAGHTVRATFVAGGGTLGSATSQQDGSYAIPLQPPPEAGSAVIEASADGIAISQRANVSYVGGRAATYQLTTAPANTMAGNELSFTLTALDSFGNRATGYQGSASLTRKSDTQMELLQQVSGTWTQVAALQFGSGDAGVVAFRIAYHLAGSQSFRIEDAANALFAESTATLVSAANVTLLSVRVDNLIGLVGTQLREPLTVQAQDRFGNGVSGVGITFVLQPTPGGGGGIGLAQQDLVVTPLSQLPTTTDVNGMASVWLTFGAAGAYLVRGTITGTGTPADGTQIGLRASAQSPQSVDFVSISASGPFPVLTPVRLVIWLRIGGANGQGVPGQAELLGLRAGGLGVSFSPISDLGTGEYDVDALPSTPGTTAMTADFNSGQATATTNATWFGASQMVVNVTPAGDVTLGSNATFTIRLLDGGQGVFGQTPALHVQLVTPAAGVSPSAYYIGPVSPGGGGDYSVLVRAAAPGTATFQVSYDFLPNPPPTSISFVARSEAPPYVTGVTPLDGATGVPQNSDIQVTFDRAMDSRTFTPGAFAVFMAGQSDFRSVSWIRLPWDTYNAVGGETRVACGDVDGDGRDEIVVGTGPYPANGGWLAVFEDGVPDAAAYGGVRFPIRAWIRLPFTDYNAANGESRPAVGDVDGDGRAEIVVGLGPAPMTAGKLAVFDDGSTGFAFKRWLQVNWPLYNSSGAAGTRPAVGDFDGDGLAEVAIGLDPYPSAGGWVELKDDAVHGYAHRSWVQCFGTIAGYDQANGETRPAAGDVDGDRRDELLVGMGRFAGGLGGFVEIRDDLVGQSSLLARTLVPDAGYCSANGETWPSAGDVNGDGIAEVVVGVGSYPANGGYVYIFDNGRMDVPQPAPFRFLASRQLMFAGYNLANGETRPAVGNVVGSPPATSAPAPNAPGRHQIVTALGSYPSNGGWLEVRGATTFENGGQTPMDQQLVRWTRIAWQAAGYNAANGEEWAACGDVDGDGADETVVGQGRYGTNGGWAVILDDAKATSKSHVSGWDIPVLGWIRLEWTNYNALNGEVRPAVGDLDGNGKAEIVLGIGPSNISRGWLEIFGDSSTGYASRGWLQLANSNYNNAIGATRPAIGHFTAGHAGQIAVGLDRPTGQGSTTVPGGAWILFDDANHAYAQTTHFLNWSVYNAAVGETHPAAGDVNRDGLDEVILGLGRYTTAGGWVEIQGNGGNGFAHQAWLRAPNTSDPYWSQNGETWPASGDLDGDGAAEVVVGLGTYTANGGRLFFYDSALGANGAYAYHEMRQINFPAYNAANGATRPAIGRVIATPSAYSPPVGDSRQEIVTGLGPYAPAGGWIEVRGPSGPIAGTASFTLDALGRTVAVFHPEQQLLGGVSYDVRVQAATPTDLSGNPFDQSGHPGDDGRGDFASSFTVDGSDRYPPTVVRVSPAGDAQRVSSLVDMVVEFSEAVTVSPSYFTLRRLSPNPSSVAGSVTMQAGGRVAVFHPSTPLTTGGTYEVQLLTGITDLGGNRLATTFTSSFTVVDLATPVPPIFSAPPPPSAGQRWRFNTVRFSGVAEPNGTIEFHTGGMVIARGSVSASGSFDLTVPSGANVLTEGPHSIYAVVITSGGVQSARSVTVELYIDTVAPAPPRNVTATPGDSYVDLAWESSADDDVLGYIVNRSTDQQNWVVINPRDPNNASRVFPLTTTQFRDSTVTNGTTYYYRVQATDTAQPEQ